MKYYLSMKTESLGNFRRCREGSLNPHASIDAESPKSLCCCWFVARAVWEFLKD